MRWDHIASKEIQGQEFFASSPSMGYWGIFSQW